MSAFTSTSVNKGAVKVAPKARGRRAAPSAAPSASHVSTRGTPGPTQDPASVAQELVTGPTGPHTVRTHRASSNKTSGRLIAPGRRPSRLEETVSIATHTTADRFAPVFEEHEGPHLTTQERKRLASTSSRRRSSAGVIDAAQSRRASTTGRTSPVAERPGVRGRKKREASPDDGTVELIDGSIKMADLCKGSGRGQKSSKFAKFEEIIAERKRDKKLGRKEQAPAPRELPVHNDPGSVIKTRVVNGEIVLDPESLTVDRSQRLADLDGPREVVDVDDMKRRVNSASHGKPIGKVRWDDTATEQFYTALSQWGTDFEMIAQMFPSRDRKQIKSKFTLEERRNPHLITRALIRKKPVDMEVYAKQSAKTFRPIEELEAELQQLRDRYEEERQASMKEAEQRKQEMQSQAQAMPALPEKRKSRRLRAGDDGVELLGTIEEVEDAAKLQARHEDDDDEDD